MTADEMLDYALGQLDPVRAEQVEHEAAADAALAGRLARLDTALDRLLDDGQDFDPPADLAARTLRFVSERRNQPSYRINEWMPARVPFRVADVAVAAVIFLAGIVTLLPAVLRMRSQMQTARCMSQLQQLGVGLTSYSLNHGHYPQPPLGHPAGYYGIQLLKDGAVDDARLLACPSQGVHADLVSLGKLDQFDDLLTKQPAVCEEMLETGYAYHAGYRAQPKRPSPLPAKLNAVVPLLADGPPLDSRTRKILSGNSPNHGGGGQNVLFNDNHVEWLRHRRHNFDDDIYLNGNRRPGLGVHRNDISLIPAVYRVSE